MSSDDSFDDSVSDSILDRYAIDNGRGDEELVLDIDEMFRELDCWREVSAINVREERRRNAAMIGR